MRRAVPGVRALLTGWGTGGWCTPLDMPRGHVQGGTPPPLPHPVNRARTPVTASRPRTGLWAQWPRGARGVREYSGIHGNTGIHGIHGNTRDYREYTEHTGLPGIHGITGNTRNTRNTRDIPGIHGIYREYTEYREYRNTGNTGNTGIPETLYLWSFLIASVVRAGVSRRLLVY